MGPEKVTWFTEKKSSGQTANYSDLRLRGLEQRRFAKPGEVPRDMRELYQFWASFLINDFNAGLYEEFRAHALEDANPRREGASAKYGLLKLMAFYNEVLANEDRRLWAGTRAYPEVLNAHYEEAKRVAAAAAAAGSAVPAVVNGAAQV